MNIKKNLSVLFFALVVLSACGQGTPAVQVGGDADLPKSEVIQDEARGTIKKMSCEDLASEASRQECTVQVNDIITNQVSREITRTYDLNRCSVLPAQMKARCIETIEATGIKGPLPITAYDDLQQALRADVQQEVDEQGNPVGDAVVAHNSEKCAALDQPSGMRAYCEREVTKQLEQNKLREIVRNGGSVEDCSELTNADLVRECKLAFGVTE